MNIFFEIPIEVKSEANQRGHWRKSHSRKKNQRLWARITTSSYTKGMALSEKLMITLTRKKGPGQRDFDSDNLAISFKAIRDGIADSLGVDDGSKNIEWVYRQEKGPSHGIIVNIKDN